MDANQLMSLSSDVGLLASIAQRLHYLKTLDLVLACRSYGFDPLRLGEDPAALKWCVCSEDLFYTVPQLWTLVPGAILC